LPDRIKSDYEFAIPVMDTTIGIGDFVPITADFNHSDMIEIPAGIPIYLGEMLYPFYIGDYAASQEIKWVEPHIIIDAKYFPANTIITLNIYTIQDDGEKYYFWLPENTPITLTNTTVKIPDVPDRITDIERFRHSRKVFINMSITYSEPVLLSEIIQDKLNIKFAIKLAIKTDLTIKL
jgi:hypothetical protein